jgi:hypothetical protein
MVNRHFPDERTIRPSGGQTNRGSALPATVGLPERPPIPGNPAEHGLARQLGQQVAGVLVLAFATVPTEHCRKAGCVVEFAIGEQSGSRGIPASGEGRYRPAKRHCPIHTLGVPYFQHHSETYDKIAGFVQALHRSSRGSTALLIRSPAQDRLDCRRRGPVRPFADEIQTSKTDKSWPCGRPPAKVSMALPKGATSIRFSP